MVPDTLVGYVPLIVFALVFFIGPVVLGGLFFLWLWHQRRPARRPRRAADRERAATDVTKRRRGRRAA